MSGSLRIIGGRWRSRKIKFAIEDAVRPSPDRVRETLFNWLSLDIAGASCLELFAGSGALSIEALSRGAQDVVIVDSSAQVLRQIKSIFQLWYVTIRILRVNYWLQCLAWEIRDLHTRLYI